MNEYRIEKVRFAVTAVFSGGETLTGDIFLEPAVRYRAGHQSPAELLNEREPFFALVTRDDQLVLLAKDHITRVDFEESPADTESRAETNDADVADAMVELVFADRSEFTGELRFPTRVSRSRLLDFLNGDHQRFLTLRSSAGVSLVNREHVAHVRRRP